MPLAPRDASAGYAGSRPLPGETITIGAGVPGLAAGTYTLLPAYYALLPGAFRVEVGRMRSRSRLSACAADPGR